MPLHTFRSSFILSFLLISITVAQEVSLNDFRIRESRYQRWDIQTSGLLSFNSQGITNNVQFGNMESIDLGTAFNRAYESEDRFYSVSIQLSANTAKHYSRLNGQWDTAYSTSRREELWFDIQAQYGKYLVPDSWYLFAETNIDTYRGLSRSEGRSTNTLPFMSFNKNTSLYGNLTGGIGYGKMRDARAVIVIVRILEDLSEEGVLVRPLSNEEIIAMAEQYHADLTTTGEFDRRTKHLIGTIIGDLMEKGLITAQKSIGYVTGRSIEVFSEQIYPRPIGWKVKTGPVINDNQWREQKDNGSNRFFKNPRHRWEVSGEYGRALTQQMHFTSSAAIDIPVLSWQKQLEGRFMSMLTHEIGERSSAMVSLSWNKTEIISNINNPGAGHNTTSSYTLAGQYSYLLEDNLLFSAGIDFTESRSIGEQLFMTTRMIRTSGSVHFQLQYRID